MSENILTKELLSIVSHKGHQPCGFPAEIRFVNIPHVRVTISQDQGALLQTITTRRIIADKKKHACFVQADDGRKVLIGDIPVKDINRLLRITKLAALLHLA